MRPKRPTLFKGTTFRSRDHCPVCPLVSAVWAQLPQPGRDDGRAESPCRPCHDLRWVERYAPELDRRCRRELRMTNGSWRVDETYLRVAGRWTYLYRAVDSAGDTIDFLLSVRRDAAGAKRFFQKALRSPDHPRPRVINVDGNPSYPKVITELKKTGELGRRCWCRPVRYLNNIVEIVFTQMTKPNVLVVRMCGDYVTDLDF